MTTSFLWEPASNLMYFVSLGWTHAPQGPTYGGWWPGKDDSMVPWGTCTLHGAWDTSRYTCCPICTTAAAPMQFRVYPELPEPPPVLEAQFVGEKTPHRCPVCFGKGLVPAGFYNTSPNPVFSSTADEECRACEQGVIWR